MLSVLAALCASLLGVLAVFPSSALSRVTTPQPGPVTTVTSVTVFLWLTICSDIVDKWVTLCVVSASGGTSLATDPVPGRGVAAQFYILQISNVESTHMLSCCIPHDFQYMGHDSTQETGCRGSRPHPSIAESCQQTMWQFPMRWWWWVTAVSCSTTASAGPWFTGRYPGPSTAPAGTCITNGSRPHSDKKIFRTWQAQPSLCRGQHLCIHHWVKHFMMELHSELFMVYDQE